MSKRKYLIQEKNRTSGKWEDQTRPHTKTAAEAILERWRLWYPTDDFRVVKREYKVMDW